MLKKNNKTNINNTEILIPKEHSMLSTYGELYYEHIDKIKDKIKKSAENYLNIFKDYPYIFNLGHGVLPETKPETIEYLIKVVREKK